jgi:hypothetical protein
VTQFKEHNLGWTVSSIDDVNVYAVIDPFRDLDTDTYEYRGDLKFNLSNHTLEQHVRGIKVYLAQSAVNLNGQVIEQKLSGLDLSIDPLVKPTIGAEQQALSLSGVNQYVYKVPEATQYSPMAACLAGSCFLVVTFVNADGDEQETKGAVLLADAQMTAGRFSIQDLDLDPVQYGGDLYFNVT